MAKPAIKLRSDGVDVTIVDEPRKKGIFLGFWDSVKKVFGGSPAKKPDSGPDQSVGEPGWRETGQASRDEASALRKMTRELDSLGKPEPEEYALPEPVAISNTPSRAINYPEETGSSTVQPAIEHIPTDNYEPIGFKDDPAPETTAAAAASRAASIKTRGAAAILYTDSQPSIYTMKEKVGLLLGNEISCNDLPEQNKFQIIASFQYPIEHLEKIGIDVQAAKQLLTDEGPDKWIIKPNRVLHAAQGLGITQQELLQTIRSKPGFEEASFKTVGSNLVINRIKAGTNTNAALLVNTDVAKDEGTITVVHQQIINIPRDELEQKLQTIPDPQKLAISKA